MAADQRAQLQNYTHQLGQRDSEFAAMRQRMDELRYFQVAGWLIKHELMHCLKAAPEGWPAAMRQLEHLRFASCVLPPVEAWVPPTVYVRCLQ